MIEVRIWEDNGPVISGRGTTTTEITNFNWKNHASTSELYWHYPIRRPEDSSDGVFSYSKYIFFELYGTASLLKNVKMNLSAVPGMNTRLYYKFTNVYAAPVKTMLGDLTYLDGPIQWWPNLGSAPNTATTRPKSLSGNISVFTQYLTTQLFVINSSYNDVGNTAQIELSLSYNEHE